MYQDTAVQQEENKLHDIYITREIYFDEKNGFYVAAMGDGNSVKINGAILPVKGDVTVFGAWKDDPRYGHQLVAKQLYFKDPKAATAILLANGFLTGIKKSKALQVMATLGDRIFEVLEACSNEEDIEWRGQTVPASFALQTVKGIGPTVYKQVIKSYRDRRAVLGAAIIAIQAGLNMRQYRAALQEIGADKLNEYINKSPYKLSTVSYFNWDTVDAIAQLSWEGKIPVPHDSPTRLAAAVREVITRYNSNGHMAMPVKEAIFEARKLSRPGVDLWATIKDCLKEEGIVTLREGGQDWITTRKLFDMENEAARSLVDIMNFRHEQPLIDLIKVNIQSFAKFTLAPEQREAIECALTNNVSAITGGPGTGKTTGFLQTLLAILEKHHISYTLCAPTGKAAIRMSESTGRQAATLHREFRLFDPIDLVPLSSKYLIVDESSMISSDIFCLLTRVVEPGQRIVFIGDSDQLPPVGPGEPLMQLLTTENVPSVKLKTIFRQGANSGIITAAHDINNGIDPKTSENGDFFIQQVTDQTAWKELLQSFENLYKLGLNRENIMVLTPVNDKPNFGRKFLNEQLQEHFNPTGEKIRGSKLRIGDPVIQTKNNYDLDIMNGQIGTIIWAKDVAGEVDAMFDEENEKAVLKVQFEFKDEPTPLKASDMQELQLAYALTIHKTQGSQYKAVIVMVPYVYKEFFLRQLVYTGITRAEEFCTVLNHGNALHSYVINEKKLRRMSLLSKMIIHYDKESDK